MKPAGQSVCAVCAFLGQCASLLWSFSNVLVWLCVCCGFACGFLVCFLLLWGVGGGGSGRGCFLLFCLFVFCFRLGCGGEGVEPPVTIGCHGSGKL